MVFNDNIKVEIAMCDIDFACKRKGIDFKYHYSDIHMPAGVVMLFTKNNVRVRRVHTCEYIANLIDIDNFVERVVEEINGSLRNRRLYISTAWEQDSFVKKCLEEAKKEMNGLKFDKFYFPRVTTVPEIKKVIYNGPCTIVLWEDGTKTIVKCQRWDTFDKEKGLAMAICKKVMGNNKSHSNYNDIFKKWCKDDDVNKPIGIIRLD